MRRYLPLLLLMGLLTIANVSSTDYLYAYGDVGETGYLDVGDELFDYEFFYGDGGNTGYLDAGDDDESIAVYKTDDFTRENVKFWVKRYTRCQVIDLIDYYLWIAIRIVIDEGSHEGETGWAYWHEFHSDED